MKTTLWALAGLALGTAACLTTFAKDPDKMPTTHRKPLIRPYICAHRGASAVAPENTMAAFRLARQLGADAIELDTTLTADGVLVINHDGTVDRTSNGKGAVGKLTLAQIKALDSGSWKDARYKGEPVPTLEEVLKDRGPLFVNIELKVNEHGVAPLAKEAVRLIEKYRAVDDVVISSFSGEALEAVHKLNPRIGTGFLYSGKTPDKLPEGITALHPMYPTVTPEYMQWAKSKGYEVNVWTVDDPKEMSRLIGLGVDSIITNTPDRMRDLLKRPAKS